MKPKVSEFSIVSEWDFIKNYILPENITIGSSKKVWWKCKNNHSWLAPINKRISRGDGCPYCSGQRVCLENSLLMRAPNLVKEWSEKNTIKPNEITAKSNKKVWWKCKYGHEWKSSPNNRVNHGCPCCSGKFVNDVNNLKVKNPELLCEWDYNKNIILPSMIHSKSNKKIWWKCKNNHSWYSSLYNRTCRGDGCPYCSNKKVCIDNCLFTINPDLALEWDYTKNSITPYDITPYSSKKVWWKCKNNHSWKTSVNHRSSGTNCPFCAGKKSCKENCLKNPKLCKEWDYIKNSITPYDVTPHSSKKVWWKCKNNHSWFATINSRNQGSGCPICVKYLNSSKKCNLWLDQLNIDLSNREVCVIINKKKFYVDALIENIVYEFYGDFWHGNPKIYSKNEINPVSKKTYGTLYENTIKRENLIKTAGYKIISIWENDFDELVKIMVEHDCKMLGVWPNENNKPE